MTGKSVSFRTRFRNLEFANENKSIAFATILTSYLWFQIFHSALGNPCLREAASAKAGEIRNATIHLSFPNHKGCPSHEAEDDTHPERCERRRPSGR